MKNIRYIIVALFVFAFSSASMAQTATSTYFLDGALYKYKLNPAMRAERPYLTIATGNLSFGTKGNIGLSNFIYPYGDDKLTTFMSGTVDQNKFLNSMPDITRLGFNLDETILGFGFRMFGGYTSFGISLHSSTSLLLPKGLFEFAKKGFQESAYSFSGININTMNYAAVTLGYSHDIFESFRIGVNAKYLVGLAHADLTVDRLNIEMSENRWLVESHAKAQAAIYCEADITTNEDGIIDSFTLGKIGAPTAYGFGLDLGIEYDMDAIVPGLILSAAVVDLGYINWQYMMSAQSADGKVQFDGFREIDHNDIEASIEKEFERLGEDAAKMIDFTYEGVKKGVTKLSPTVNLGIEYKMPFYRPLSLGVLYSQRFSEFECDRIYQARGYLNFAPLKWLSASVNYGQTTYGKSLGWMFSIHPRIFNFFIGSDYMITRVTPQYIPIDNLNTHLTIGISASFGKRK